MKMFFTPYVRIVFYFCALIFIVYSFSDFFQGVPDSTFFSAVITLLVIGTIVARKRLVRTVLIFTESSDQLSRATDRVPGLPASPGYVQ
ncbi:hypothetical protein D9G49_25500 [Escherichia coli]|nr:hypothetical protein [Escherichia coli]MIC83422.1 hypothetical protein [Escherichia coli]